MENKNKYQIYEFPTEKTKKSKAKQTTVNPQYKRKKDPIDINARRNASGLLYCFVYFLFGALGYASIEILWRGRTHWTMALLGGIVMLVLYWLTVRFKDAPLLALAVFGAAAITVLELICGVIVNKQYDLGVWSYNGMDYNILGQVCPLYTFFWFLLCIPALLIIKKTKNMFVGRQPTSKA